jgi:translation initiation factor 3 subunit B
MKQTNNMFICCKGDTPASTSNTIRWSPRGRFVVLAAIGSATKSELQFWDLDFDTDVISRKGAQKDGQWDVGVRHLGTAEHYGVTDIEWDPSGRYVGTSASAWKHSVWLSLTSAGMLSHCQVTA